MVMFALLILPTLGTNRALLTNVELSSMAKHNYHYKATMIAQILLFIYLGLTLCVTLALKLAGLNWFDSLTQGMSVVATSGFSTKNASIGYFDSVAVEVEAGGHDFRASSSSLKFSGYTAVYEEGRDEEKEEKESPLPELREGEALALEGFAPNQHFTQPPARYTDASLILSLIHISEPTRR